MARRLFIGLQLPESWVAEFAELDPHLPGLRWLPGDLLHLTLGFYGAVQPAEEERLHAALTEVRVPPFFLPLQGIGAFKVGGKPSVVWVGVGNGHPHLFALHRHVQDAAIRAGLEPDLKPFHPHVTLARAKGLSSETLKPFLRRHAETEFGMWQVTGFELFSSVLAPEGSTHYVELRQEFLSLLLLRASAPPR